jgi:hypothetical protein
MAFEVLLAKGGDGFSNGGSGPPGPTSLCGESARGLVETARWSAERATGFEPATSSLGSLWWGRRLLSPRFHSTGVGPGKLGGSSYQALVSSGPGIHRLRQSSQWPR